MVTPLLPAHGTRRGRPWNDHRRTLKGICWWFRTELPWRDVPEVSGPYQSLWKRHKQWSVDGTYQRMLDAVIGSDLSDTSVVELSTRPRSGRISTPQGHERTQGGPVESQEI